MFYVYTLYDVTVSSICITMVKVRPFVGRVVFVVIFFF